MSRFEEVVTHKRAVQLSAGRISVVDQGRGLPVLLGHGFLWDHDMWAPQIGALSRHCRLLVPEMWGHGASSALPPATRTLSDLADQMIELLDMLEIDRCVVAGSSMGGMWGAHLAARAPDRVAGLVLMNSFLGEEPALQRAAYRGLLDQVAADGGVSDQLADTIVPLFFAPDVASRTPELPHDLRRRLAAFAPAVLRQSIVPLGRMIFDRPDALSILSQIRAPTLVLAGAGDRARPPHESEEMARLMDAELTVIPACGHTATLEQPEHVTAALLGFLQRLNWAGEGDQPATG